MCSVVVISENKFENATKMQYFQVKKKHGRLGRKPKTKLSLDHTHNTETTWHSNGFQVIE